MKFPKDNPPLQNGEDERQSGYREDPSRCEELLFARYNWFLAAGRFISGGCFVFANGKKHTHLLMGYISRT